MMKTRGAVDPLTILILVGVLAFAGGALKLPTWFQKKPPVAQLSTAQDELAKAKAAQQQAEARLAELEAQQKAVGDKQLDYAQQMATGTVLALGRIAPGQVTPEVKLASEFATRAEAGLIAYRGALSPEARAEMEHMVAQALSAVQAERDAMKQALLAKDAALAQTIAVKSTLEAQIPTLEANVAAARAETAAKDAKAVELTKEVSVWAEQKVAADAKASSLDAYAGNLLKGLIACVVLYVLVHFVLPSLAQEFPASKVLTWANKTTKSISSSHL